MNVAKGLSTISEMEEETLALEMYGAYVLSGHQQLNALLGLPNDKIQPWHLNVELCCIDIDDYKRMTSCCNRIIGYLYITKRQSINRLVYYNCDRNHGFFLDYLSYAQYAHLLRCAINCNAERFSSSVWHIVRIEKKGYCLARYHPAEMCFVLKGTPSVDVIKHTILSYLRLK